MRRRSQADRRVVTREAFDHQHLRERVGSAAAPFFRERDAEETQLAEVTNHMARKEFLLVPFGGMRLDFALGEFGEGRADLPLLFGEVEVHQDSSLKRLIGAAERS